MMVQFQDKPKLDREAACKAAARASTEFGQWVPQRWLDIFMSAYDDQMKDHSDGK